MSLVETVLIDCQYLIIKNYIMSFESKIIVSVELFNKKDENGNQVLDKNNKQPVMLRVLAGKCPNRNVISGTVAENSKFKIGKCYFVQVQEIEPDEVNGRQFRFINLSKVSVNDAIKAEETLGKPEMITIDKTAVATNATTANKAADVI
jgi:hypothetical protein